MGSTWEVGVSATFFHNYDGKKRPRGESGLVRGGCFETGAGVESEGAGSRTREAAHRWRENLGPNFGFHLADSIAPDLSHACGSRAQGVVDFDSSKSWQLGHARCGSNPARLSRQTKSRRRRAEIFALLIGAFAPATAGAGNAPSWLLDSGSFALTIFYKAKTCRTSSL
jgi:hypothetical protein